MGGSFDRCSAELSESLVQGFNGGSLDFVLDGHIHSMEAMGCGDAILT